MYRIVGADHFGHSPNYIELKNYSLDETFDFKLNTNSREKLIESGYTQSIEQFDNLINNLYLEQTKLNKNIYNKYSIYNEI